MYTAPSFFVMSFYTFLLRMFLFLAVRTQLRLCDLIVCVGHPDKQASQNVQKTLEQQQHHHHQ